MNNINIDEIIIENEQLKQENNELKDKLKSYTNTNRHKKYYEKNKDIVKEKGKKYLEELKEKNPNKLKEYRHNAYLKRKEKNKDDNEYIKEQKNN